MRSIRSMGLLAALMVLSAAPPASANGPAPHVSELTAAIAHSTLMRIELAPRFDSITLSVALADSIERIDTVIVRAMSLREQLLVSNRMRYLERSSARRHAAVPSRNALNRRDAVHRMTRLSDRHRNYSSATSRWNHQRS